MESKLKPTALQIAAWGLAKGDFFDFHEVAERLGIPAELARAAVVYLRSLRYVDTQAETRSCKREARKRSPQRVFIKVLAIHPEPLPGSQSFRLNVLRSKLARLSKAMPSPRGAR
ncbi:hypothetical protein [Aeromonas salmonicida]|uniref:hypothetical protein n=1 Tax=Aeromonas salmonicida TaxID=645 RepID=UPI00240D0A9A|nr:hypothetical protein [Aeromonas salmonicida]WFC15413.1 hypothetical protein L3V47_06595 [Aeromonas salmonicida]